MSGGRFDYRDYMISEFADEIDQEIRENEEPREWEDQWKGERFNEKTIEEFRKTIDLLREAAIRVHRIDYLLSGDDGEERFHERLRSDLLKAGIICDETEHS